MIWSGRRDSNPRLQPWQGCHVQLWQGNLGNYFVSY